MKKALVFLIVTLLCLSSPAFARLNLPIPVLDDYALTMQRLSSIEVADVYSAGNGSAVAPDGSQLCYSGATIVICPTSNYAGTFSGALTFSGTPSFSNAAPFALTNTGTNTITSATTGAAGAFTINDTGAATGSLFKVQSNGTSELTLGPSGTLTLGATATASTIVFSSTANGNGFNSLASGSTVGYIFNTSNGPTELAYFQNGGSNAFTISNGGLAQGNQFGQITTCAQTTTNASPSLLTLTQWGCQLTSGSASATVFTITYPGSFSTTNPPLCLIQDLAAAVVEPTCVTTTSHATITYNAAPGAVAFANIFLFRNGP